MPDLPVVLKLRLLPFRFRDVKLRLSPQLSSGPDSVAAVANGDLTLDDLPAQFDLNTQPADLAALLPAGEAELAGDDVCPPPPTGPSADTRALGQ